MQSQWVAGRFATLTYPLLTMFCLWQGVALEGIKTLCLPGIRKHLRLLSVDGGVERFV